MTSTYYFYGESAHDQVWQFLADKTEFHREIYHQTGRIVVVLSR